MKKKFLLSLLGILFLGLSSCSMSIVDVENPFYTDKWPNDNPSLTPLPDEAYPTSIEITNKENLMQPWNLTDEDRKLSYSITYSNGFIRSTGATIKSNNTDSVEVIGRMLHSKRSGFPTITVSIGALQDSVNLDVYRDDLTNYVTIDEYKNKQYDDTTSYILDGYITGWLKGNDATKYGNFYLGKTKDTPVSESILVYGSTEEQSALTYNESTRKWNMELPNHWNPSIPFDYEKYIIGDYINIQGIKQRYRDTTQLTGIILKHNYQEANEIIISNQIQSLGNTYTHKFNAVDNLNRKCIDFSIASGTAATISKDGLLTPLDTTGRVTVRATSRLNSLLYKDIEVDIVNTPLIIKNATFDEILNDSSENFTKIYEINAKTLENLNSPLENYEGIFDWVEETTNVHLSSIGLSKNENSLKYVNGKFEFKNDNSFLNSGILLGSENVYKAIVTRADTINSDGTIQKNVVGHVVYGEEPLVQEVSFDQLLTIKPNSNSAYIVSGYITGYESGKTNAGDYGNFYLGKNKGDDISKSILVYGATEVSNALSWDPLLKRFIFKNPNSSHYEGDKIPFNHMDYMIGDFVKLKVIILGHKGKNELTGVLLEHTSEPRPTTFEVIYNHNELGIIEERHNFKRIENGKKFIFEARMFKNTKIKFSLDNALLDKFGYSLIRKGKEFFALDSVSASDEAIVLEEAIYTFTYYCEYNCIDVVKESITNPDVIYLDFADKNIYETIDASYLESKINYNNNNYFIISSGNYGPLGGDGKLGLNIGTNKTKESDYKGGNLPLSILKACDPNATTNSYKAGDYYYYGIYMNFDIADINKVRFEIKETNYTSMAKEVMLLQSRNSGKYYEKVNFVYDDFFKCYNYQLEYELPSVRFAIVLKSQVIKLRYAVKSLFIS